VFPKISAKPLRAIPECYGLAGTMPGVGQMRRHGFITLLAGAAAWPLAARAQPTGKVYRIGYLGVTSYAEYAREIEALLRGLRRLGYEERKNIAIVYQFAEGDYDRLPALASELVTLKVDTIVTHSTPGARAAIENKICHKATSRRSKDTLHRWTCARSAARGRAPPAQPPRG
jgi:hypothetical protein